MANLYRDSIVMASLVQKKVAKVNQAKRYQAVWNKRIKKIVNLQLAR
jgi:cell division protein YceG involved in septum cleavage